MPDLAEKQGERKMAHAEMSLRERRTIEDMLHAKFAVGPCCSDDICASSVAATGRYRLILGIVLAINAVMFLVEIIAGLAAGR
jgi:Co/Zn/Cd efflux system component